MLFADGGENALFFLNGDFRLTQDFGDGIGAGEDIETRLTDGGRAADALELTDHIVNFDTAAQGKGSQATHRFGLRGAAAVFAGVGDLIAEALRHNLL